MTKRKDNWMEILSGRQMPNPNNADEIIAHQLRLAMLKYEREQAITQLDTKKAFSNFCTKLEELNTNLKKLGE